LFDAGAGSISKKRNLHCGRMRPLSADFLVLGGGPAGSAFAILAARAGASVVLIERRGYDAPRPGEHLAAKVRGALDALKVSARAAAGVATSSPGILSLWSGGAPHTKSYSGSPPGLRVIRNRFDELLFGSARIAGAVTFVRGIVPQIEQARRKGWRAEIEVDGGDHIRVSARMIVDATGRAAAFGRNRGAEKFQHGDLFAIVSWLTTAKPARPNGGMLTVGSTPLGWWSASSTCDDTLVVSLYTSAAMMKQHGASGDTWSDRVLADTGYVSRLIRTSGAELSRRRVFAAFPSKLTRMHGPGWIAIGEAAVAFDPLCGQGVAYALESAFRAFEAVSLDVGWKTLGAMYQEAMTCRFDEHLVRRAEVYAEAAEILSDAFFSNAV
jgi:flavin-dependent dehydrogenase